MRIGFASDIHRLEEGRKLILSGINIPTNKGEVAHSDGDVVFHAVAESILGALALGDLGEHFPDSDPKYKDIDSAILLNKVVEMMFSEGYQINNIDVSITLETPKLKDYKKDMVKNLANLLKTDIKNVSIKAGTNEKLDSLGQGLAVKADSIVMLKER